MSWESDAKKILKLARSRIKESSHGNGDDWFKINRYVYSRLLLDERKKKPKKIDLFDRQKGICWICNEHIDNIKDTDTHRVNEKMGYDDMSNVVLVHRSCHQRIQTKNG